MSTKPRRKQLIVPKRALILPSSRRALPRPAPWIWVPKRFAPKMAVAFDAKATAVQGISGAGSPITNSTLTVGASGTLVIGAFACVMSAGGTLPVPSAMTWNSVAMTAVGHQTSSDGLSNIYVYAIVNPTTGNHSCQATFSAGAGTFQVDLDCFSYSGTNTSSVANAIPSANVITNATNSSATLYPSTAFSVTTVSGDMACAAMNSAVIAFTNVVAGNIRNTENGGTVNYAAGDHAAVGSSTSLQFNTVIGGSAGPCCGVAFDIAQPGSAFTWLAMDEESNSSAALHQRKVEMVGY